MISRDTGKKGNVRKQILNLTLKVAKITVPHTVINKNYIVIFKLSDEVYNATYLEAGTANNKNLWKESLLQNQLSC